jgi:hypothetical protein
MLSSNATTNKPNSAYPRFLHLWLAVPLLEIVKPVNPDNTERKSTVSETYLLPRCSHIAKTLSHADKPKIEAQFPEPYRNASTSEYPISSFRLRLRVVLNKLSSSVIKTDTNHPPMSMAKPRASKAESTYIPILQLLTMIFGFASFLQRNDALRLILVSVFLITGCTALFLSFQVAVTSLSTRISHLISSTVNFTLPYVR